MAEETIESPIEPTNVADARLLYTLRNLSQQTSADMACVYVRSRDTQQPQLVAVYPENANQTTDNTRVLNWLQERLERMAARGSRSISGPTFYSLDENIGFAGGVLWSMLLPGDVPAGVVLFYKQRTAAFTPESAPEADVLVELIQTTLENQLLVERLLTTEAIATTAQAITRNPTPRGIVHVLRDYLFEPNVSSCTLLLYGPSSPEQPYGPFEYVEVAALWVQGNEAPGAVGDKIPLTDFLVGLDRTGIVTITDKDQIAEIFQGRSEPPVTAETTVSITFIPLHAEQRKLGILVITSNAADAYTAYQLRSFQLVAEFLTMITLTDLLQRQSDDVERGRAALLDAVTDGVVMVRNDQAASVLTVNQQFLSMFGLQERPVEGLSLAKLMELMPLPATTRRELGKAWQTTDANRRERREGEFHMIHRGSAYDVEWYSAPVYKDQEFLGRIYTFHDVTSKRASERLRSELLSRISHELRTPLTSISGFAQFILDATKDDLPDLAREYTEIILSSARHLTILFRDMIDLARANAGELKLHLTSDNLNDRIIESVAKLEMQYKQRKQRVIMSLNDDLPDIDLDNDRISQVLTNLIYNAIKYGPEGGEIRVSNRLISSESDLPKSAPPQTYTPCVLVSVLDRGVGIPETEVDKIFIPFYRTRATRAQQVEGAGLGLAVSRGIIELHGGRIWVEPATRRQPGGRFYFTLPVTQN
ncbi:MAG: ATP-binding protein [bacterium]|nr:ATP-binding protein [bacterium]